MDVTSPVLQQRNTDLFVIQRFSLWLIVAFLSRFACCSPENILTGWHVKLALPLALFLLARIWKALATAHYLCKWSNRYEGGKMTSSDRSSYSREVATEGSIQTIKRLFIRQQQQEKRSPLQSCAKHTGLGLNARNEQWRWRQERNYLIGATTRYRYTGDGNALTDLEGVLHSRAKTGGRRRRSFPGRETGAVQTPVQSGTKVGRRYRTKGPANVAAPGSSRLRTFEWLRVKAPLDLGRMIGYRSVSASHAWNDEVGGPKSFGIRYRKLRMRTALSKLTCFFLGIFLAWPRVWVL